MKSVLRLIMAAVAAFVLIGGSAPAPMERVYSPVRIADGEWPGGG